MILIKTLHDKIQMLARSTQYKFGANGDNRLMASFCLMMSLSHQFDYANYAFKKVIEISQNNCMSKETRECFQLMNVQQSILYYSACYDTLLQIIYFAFHFAPLFKNQKEFVKSLNGCVWIKRKGGLKAQMIKSIKDSFEREFFDRVSDLYENKRIPLQEIANTIKHRGGVSTPTLNTYLPEIANGVQKITIIKNGDDVEFDIPEQFSIIKASWFYPLSYSMEYFVDILRKNNLIVYDFVEYLFGIMNLNEKALDDCNFKLPFYCQE